MNVMPKLMRDSESYLVFHDCAVDRRGAQEHVAFGSKPANFPHGKWQNVDFIIMKDLSRKRNPLQRVHYLFYSWQLTELRFVERGSVCKLIYVCIVHKGWVQVRSQYVLSDILRLV